jgi:Kef-type K+ transport system membrane component KefB
MTGLFPVPTGTDMPVSPELYGIATLASILLLYLAGLETDMSKFLRYSVAGTLVGLGGVVVSFALGDALAVWGGLAPSYGSPAALFLGTISTATSVGITARILSERNKLDSAEGVTILAGAVIDDVLGIILLAVVVGMTRLSGDGAHVDWRAIGLIAAKALGFWLLCTVAGILLAPRVSRGLEFFRSHDTMASVSLGLALLLAGLSEKAGLAMIIGAYITGLSLSRVDTARALQQHLEPVHRTLVSVFFCVMGMMVNVHAMKGVLLFGLLYSAVAVLAKVLGCGLPALFMRFNLLGAARIGVGMLPRGEVALIVAGIGLSAGAVDSNVFGVAILMTLITTVLAPLFMVRLFDERPGRRQTAAEAAAEAETPPISLLLPSEEAAEFVLQRIVRMFEAEECYVHQLAPGQPTFLVRKDTLAITVARDGAGIRLACGERERHFARLVLLDALADLVAMLDGLRQAGAGENLRAQVLS